MQKRITFCACFDEFNLKKIELCTKIIKDKLCKVPFGKHVEREEVDTLPYHLTLSAWDIRYKDKIIDELSKIEYPKLKIVINNIDIIKGKENSYVLCFKIEKKEVLKILQSKIYKILPCEKYNPETFDFHITIHIDKDYNKIISMKEKILESFIPFELEIDSFNLYEIYPAKLIKQFSL